MADSRSPVLTAAFAPIAGGWFTMGTQLGQEDERPPHPVFVDRFELGVCPVTRAEYECFVDATRHSRAWYRWCSTARSLLSFPVAFRKRGGAVAHLTRNLRHSMISDHLARVAN